MVWKVLVGAALVAALGLIWGSLAHSAPDASVGPASKPAVTTEGALTPATQPAEPKDAGEAVGVLKDTIAAGKAHRWWYMSSLVCLLIMFLLKAFKVLEKIGKWKYVVLPILSLASALLAAFQGGVSIETAVGVFTSAWAMGMLEELVNHGILGKPHLSKGGSSR